MRVLPAACVLTLAATLSPASAQPQQTAAGAQKFLAMLAKDQGLYVRIRDKKGAYLALSGTRTVTYRWLKEGVLAADGPYPDSTEAITGAMKGMLQIADMQSVDRTGAVNDCVTLIETFTTEKLGSVSTEDSFVRNETFFSTERVPYRRTTTEEFEDAAAKYGKLQRVGWGKAVVTRHASGRVFATFPGSRADLELVYASEVTKDPEMTDRVEYAMKFLKASCDKTATTGF